MRIAVPFLVFVIAGSITLTAWLHLDSQPHFPREFFEPCADQCGVHQKLAAPAHREDGK